MEWKKHLTIGVLVSLVFISLTYHYLGWFMLSENLVDSSFILAQIIVLTLISPLIMDLDQKNSKLSNTLIGIGLVASLVGITIWGATIKLGLPATVSSNQWVTALNTVWIYPVIIGVLIASVAYFTSKIFTHRGFLHTFPFLLIFGGLVWIITANYQMSILGMIGSYTHMISDRIPFRIVSG